MVVNTINELVNLLNQVDVDATVLAAISNDSATSTENGPGPGLVTTRSGAVVKNVQKLIDDIENGVVEAGRPDIWEDGILTVDSPSVLNFAGTAVTVTDDSNGLATITIDQAGDVVQSGAPLINEIAYWEGNEFLTGSSKFTWIDTTETLNLVGDTPSISITDTVSTAVFVIATFGGELIISADPAGADPNSVVRFDVDNTEIGRFDPDGFGVGIAPVAGTKFNVQSGQGQGENARFYRWDAEPIISGYRGNGQENVTPTAALADDILLRLAGHGFDASGDGFSERAATIELIANETYTSLAHGSRIEFSTTDDTTVGTNVRMTIDHNGQIGFGTQNPAKALHVINADATVRLEDSAAAANGYSEVRSASDASLYLSADPGNLEASSKVVIEVDGSESARFTDNGRLGIGEAAPEASLHITGTDQGVITGLPATTDLIVEDENAGITLIGNATTGTGRVNFGDPDSGDVGRIFYNHATDHMAFDVANSERMRIDANGISTNAGDDYFIYDEGTFTPVVADAATAGNTGTATTAFGSYVRIGQQVTVTILLGDIDTTGMTAGNDFYIRGLPFNSLTDANGRFTASPVIQDVTYSELPVVILEGGATDALRLSEAATGAGLDYILVSEVASGTADIGFTLTYFTDTIA